MPLPFSTFTPSEEHNQDAACQRYASRSTESEISLACAYTGGNTLRAVAGLSDGAAYVFLDDSAGGAYYAADEDTGALFQMLLSELTRRQWSVNSDPQSSEHFSCDLDAFADTLNDRYGLTVEATV